MAEMGWGRRLWALLSVSAGHGTSPGEGSVLDPRAYLDSWRVVVVINSRGRKGEGLGFGANQQ